MYSFCVNTNFISEIRSYGTCTFRFLETANLFPSVAVPFYIPNVIHEQEVSVNAHQDYCGHCLFCCCCCCFFAERFVEIFHCGSDLHFPDA